MSKPYSESDLVSQLTQDRTWRLREISDLRSLTEKSKEPASRVLMRSMVAMCYAHWEGYVKSAASNYLWHIALRKLPYASLHKQFLLNHFLPRLNSLSQSKQSISERCALIEEVLSASGKRFSRVNDELVSTKANLNFDVFSDICLVCNISVDSFRDSQHFIDNMLLKRRNAIAHGEDTFINITDLPILSDTTIELMRTFGEAIENIVSLKSYRSIA